MSVYKKFDCSVCDYSNSKKSQFTSHFRVHTRERPFACQYPGCTSTFIWQSQLIRHVCIHIGQKSFVCPHPGCTSSFCFHSELKKHLTIHSGEKPFTCNFCFRKFRMSDSLIKHIRTHTGEKPFKCRISGCSYACANHSNLLAHNRVHSGEKPFRCPVQNCRYSSARKHRLRDHQMRHSQQKRLKCDFKSCYYSCASSTDLRRHSRRHCDHKPDKSPGKYILTEDPKLKAPAFVLLTDVVRIKDSKFKEVVDASKMMAFEGTEAKSKEVEPEPENEQLAEKEDDDEELADHVVNAPQIIQKSRGENPSNKNQWQSDDQKLQREEIEENISPSLTPLKENFKDRDQCRNSVERRRVFKFYTVVFCPVVLSEGCVRKFRFFCHLCPKQFDQEMQVLTHLRKHTGYDLP